MSSAPVEMPPGAVGLVYGLRDVRDEDYRYVGLTRQSRPVERLWQHWSDARAHNPSAVYRWLEKRLDSQHFIVMEPLEIVMANRADLGAAEVRWIATLRAEGHRLLNLTDGGDGLVGLPWTEERRQAHLARMATFRHTDETKALMSRQRKGTRTGADNVNFGKFGPAHHSFGVPHSEERRRALSEQRKGTGNPNYGKSPSAETRAKQSAALKGIPRPSSIRSAHTRYHTNKGVMKDECRHCTDDLAAASAG